MLLDTTSDARRVFRFSLVFSSSVLVSCWVQMESVDSALYMLDVLWQESESVVLLILRLSIFQNWHLLRFEEDSLVSMRWDGKLEVLSGSGSTTVSQQP